MSTLIADTGGTSSRWALLGEGGETTVWDDLPGFNPATGDPAAFQAQLRERIALRTVPEQVRQLVVYGAGCGTEERKARMREAVQAIWPEAAITVETDLLGAARGLCGDRPGLVLILGTGMNAGHYDGTALQQRLPSLGYVLGDEGSGADIGRHLLTEALYGRMPADVYAGLFPAGLDLGEVVQRTYRSASPQAYLASFTARCADHLEEPYLRDLLTGRFRALAELLERFFPTPASAEVHATGSVAFGFQDVLGPCLTERGFRLTDVQRGPLPGLVQYHRQRPGR